MHPPVSFPARTLRKGAMQRFLHLADIHLDSSPNGRLADTVEALRRAGNLAHDRAVDAVLIAGDLVERLGRPMQPAERNALRRAVGRFADRECSVFVVAGNHDLPGDIAHLADLRGEGLIHVTERPGTWTQRGGCGAEWTDLADAARWTRALALDREPMTLIVHALPWPRRSWLLADRAAAPTTLTGLAERTTAALREVLAALRERTVAARVAAPDATVILLSHVNVRGATVANGQTMIGTDVEVGWFDLDEVGADYVALGHVHKRQSFSPRVWYPGSPCPRNFGEPERDHGGLLVEAGPGREPAVEKIVLAPVALVTVEATFERGAGALRVAVGGIVPPCDVRVRYEVSEEDAPAAMRAEAACRELLGADVRSVVFDASVAPKRTERSREVAAARTVVEKLAAYWDATDAESDPARRERLGAKLATLQAAREDA